MLKEADGRANQHCRFVKNLSEATSVEYYCGYVLTTCPNIFLYEGLNLIIEVLKTFCFEYNPVDQTIIVQFYRPMLTWPFLSSCHFVREK